MLVKDADDDDDDDDVVVARNTLSPTTYLPTQDINADICIHFSTT